MPKIYSDEYPNGYIEVDHINPYLIPGPDIFVEPRKKSFFNVPPMLFGNMPRDGGYLTLKPAERDELIAKNPAAEKYIRQYVGSEEFINGKLRYCLWLKDCPPDELRKMPLIYQRVKAVKEFRLKSKAASTRKFAETPTIFCQIAQPNKNYLLVPRVSSSRRKYIPIGFMTPDIIVSDAVLFVPDANLFHLGVLMSSVHMAWVKLVAGRLRNDYRYSATICYNPFPWPLFYSEERKGRIEKTAQNILDARENYPNATLADLYDDVAMPSDLRKAHAENDAEVMKAYPLYETDELKLQVNLLYKYKILYDDFAAMEEMDDE